MLNFYALIVEPTATASEASQLGLADTSQSVGDMQKALEMLTAVPEVHTFMLIITVCVLY